MSRLQEKKILTIVASNKFRDEEINHPREIFIKESALITVYSNSLGEAKGMLGSLE